MKKLLLISLALCSTSAFAGLSKWVDADGKVHYSDQPPPANVKAQTLRIPKETAEPAAPSGVPAASAPAAPKTIAEREAEMRKEQQTKREAAEKTAKEQEKKEAERVYCESAQQNLRALQDGVRMMEFNAKGERSYLTDEQRRQRIEKLQQDLQKYCK